MSSTYVRFYFSFIARIDSDRVGRATFTVLYNGVSVRCAIVELYLVRRLCMRAFVLESTQTSRTYDESNYTMLCIDQHTHTHAMP